MSASPACTSIFILPAAYEPTPIIWVILAPLCTVKLPFVISNGPNVIASYENCKTEAVVVPDVPKTREFIVMGSVIVTVAARSIKTSSVGTGTTSVFQFKGSLHEVASPPPSQNIVAAALACHTLN
jgi:hypothetical protein